MNDPWWCCIRMLITGVCLCVGKNIHSYVKIDFWRMTKVVTTSHHLKSNYTHIEEGTTQIGVETREYFLYYWHEHKCSYNHDNSCCFCRKLHKFPQLFITLLLLEASFTNKNNQKSVMSNALIGVEISSDQISGQNFIPIGIYKTINERKKITIKKKLRIITIIIISNKYKQ